MRIKNVHGLTFYNGMALRPSTSEFIKVFGVQVFDYIGMDEPKIVVNSAGLLCYQFPVGYKTLSELCEIMDKEIPLQCFRLIPDLIYLQSDFEKYDMVKIHHLRALDLHLMKRIHYVHAINQKNGNK